MSDEQGDKSSRLRRVRSASQTCRHERMRQVSWWRHKHGFEARERIARTNYHLIRFPSFLRNQEQVENLFEIEIIAVADLEEAPPLFSPESSKTQDFRLKYLNFLLFLRDGPPFAERNRPVAPENVTVVVVVAWRSTAHYELLARHSIG